MKYKEVEVEPDKKSLTRPSPFDLQKIMTIMVFIALFVMIYNLSVAVFYNFL